MVRMRYKYLLRSFHYNRGSILFTSMDNVRSQIGSSGGSQAPSMHVAEAVTVRLYPTGQEKFTDELWS